MLGAGVWITFHPVCSSIEILIFYQLSIALFNGCPLTEIALGYKCLSGGGQLRGESVAALLGAQALR